MSEEKEQYQSKEIRKMTGWQKLSVVQSKTPISKNIDEVFEMVKPILADVGAVILQEDVSKKADGVICKTSTAQFIDTDTGDKVVSVSADTWEKALAGLLFVSKGQTRVSMKAAQYTEGQAALKKLREMCRANGIDADDFCRTFFQVPAKDMTMNALIQTVNRFNDASAQYAKMKGTTA